MTTNAGAVGAGTANAGQIVPHPLKGIINSNDDPFACALCTHRCVNGRLGHLFSCCGKEFCRACDPQENSICPLGCFSHPLGTKIGLKMLKKRAKKGQPWAQHLLGMLYHQGSLVHQSYSEAFRWLDIAATNGHPLAMESMGSLYLVGTDRVDLSLARKYFEEALSLLPGFDACRDGLLQVAKGLLQVDNEESDAAAKSILLSLSDGPSCDPAVFDRSEALCILGALYVQESNFPNAYKFYVACFWSDAPVGAGSSAVGKSAISVQAMGVAHKLGLYAQSRFWLRKVNLANVPLKARRQAANTYFSMVPFFRQLRDACGGCGAEFEGKERKFCRRCRAFCYCSRECQKMHWNRKVNGHREDCLGLKDLKVKLKEAKTKSDEHGN